MSALAGIAQSRRLQAAVAVASVVLAGTGGAVVWLRQAPTVVSVDDALVRFRELPSPAPTPAGEPPADAVASPGTTPAPQPPAGPGGDSMMPPAAGGPSNGGAQGTLGAQGTQGAPEQQSSGAAQPGSRWPEAGVYTFRTQGGGETNALGGARHDYPAETPVIVTRAGCGYTVRWQPLNERWDEWEFCPAGPDDARRPMTRISTYHEFFKRGQRQDFACPAVEILPADRTPGRRFSWQCRSANGVVDSVTTVVGVETLDIGGAPVQALRQRFDVTFSGANEGTQILEWWVHLETGLPIHMTRDLKVKSSSPFGKIDYTERFTSTAMSLTPRR